MKRTFEGNAKNFSRYSSVMSNAHYDMAEKYRVRHRVLGLAVVIATSIVGTATFGSLAEGVAKNGQVWLKVSTGLLSILATILAALQTFLGFSDLQAQHKRGADGYSDVRRDIDLLLMTYPDVVGVPGEHAIAALEVIKKKLDDLDKVSPTIPDEIYEKSSAKTPEYE